MFSPLMEGPKDAKRPRNSRYTLFLAHILDVGNVI